MIQMLTDILNPINSFVWGPVMLVMLFGTGIFLTIGIRFMSITKIPFAFGMMWRSRRKVDGITGEISPFSALMTALAATVGTGNIVGVAAAIFIGGPGALFWMWCTALVGMATKFAETVLAMKYREVTPEGNVVGGAMYCIKNGLSKKWLWLGFAFAFFGAIAGFGIGNLTQTNAIAVAMEYTFGISRYVTAGVLFVLVGAVLLGGVSRIGQVASTIVPIMSLFYVFVASIVVIIYIDQVPAVISLVFSSAFSPSAAQGGFAGAAIMLGIRQGMARGVFSNEAGLGSAAIAHATATMKNPVSMGFIGMLGTFIDTIIVCSMTGFALLVTGAWANPVVNAAAHAGTLTPAAFEIALPGVGAIIVSVSLGLFAFTTILGWCVYSERCVMFLVGDKGLRPFRVLFTLAVPIGAIIRLDFVWLLADTFNALMAMPNLIMLLLLSPVFFKLVREYKPGEDDK